MHPTEGCDALTEKEERDVFLISSIGVLSGLMPNVQTTYDGATVKPNLFVYILGGYGSGKGATKYARMLGERVHTKFLQQNKEALDLHKQEQEKYQSANRKKKRDGGEMTAKPQEKPKRKFLFIPANNSKSGLIELLQENEHRGIIFETEADSLVDAIRQDYGNFSDILRKAFHHEPISLHRQDGRHVEIENPAISVVLSSTLDQLKALIPTSENGLFSRFAYYETAEADSTFRNVFDKKKDEYGEIFGKLADRVLSMYEALSAREKPIRVTLTEDQQRVFLSNFRLYKERIMTNESPELGGFVNRLALIVFRIAMMLAVLRNIDEEKNISGDEIICSDEDITCSFLIAEILQDTALSVFYKLPKSRETPFRSSQNKADVLEQTHHLRKQKWSHRKIAKELGLPESTLRSWLDQEIREYNKARRVTY